MALKSILVGSRAVNLHQEDSDYDIIISPAQDSAMYLYSSTNFDIFKRPFDIELLKILNSLEGLETVKIDKYDFIKAPTEVVAMMLLSSIIRIIPYHDSHEKNVQIWLKRVYQYNTLRSRMDYHEFDRRILEDEDDYLYKQFHARVQHKFDYYGDTLVTLEETERAFFKDNVQRIFDHDFIHGIVAELNRGEKTLIFPKFQDPDQKDVGINQELFEKGDQSDKIAMVQEEILALILERKVIPALYLEKKYDLESFDQDVNDVASHFATNLCGQGYHFLRKWVIDHFTIIMRIQVSPENLVQRAYQLFNLPFGGEDSPSSPKTEFSGLSPESLKIYDFLAQELKCDFLVNSDDRNHLYLTGPRTGIGCGEDNQEFYLEISVIDRVCLFKQIYLESEEVDKGVCVEDKVIQKVDEVTTHTKTRVEIKKIQVGGYYDSYDDEWIEPKIHEQESPLNSWKKSETTSDKKIMYYLNSYGSTKKFKLCEEIAKILLKIKPQKLKEIMEC